MYNMRASHREIQPGHIFSSSLIVGAITDPEEGKESCGGRSI
jgi:hypothetical protein